MNRTDIAAAIANTPDGGTLTLPNSAHQIDMRDGTIPGSRAITIKGAPGMPPIDIIPPTAPTSLFTLIPPRGATTRLADLSINGPTSLINPAANGTALNDTIACFSIGNVGDPLSTVTMERVNISGLFGSPFLRVGGGLTVVRDCEINAWEAPLKVYAAHPSDTGGKCYLLNNRLSGHGSKFTSIGIYVNRNIDVFSSHNRYDDFAYQGISSHGSPEAADGQSWVSSHDTFVDCGIGQTPTKTHAFIESATVTSTRDTRASLINGDATFARCDLRGSSAISASTTPHRVDFIDTVFTPTSIPLGIDGAGLWRFRGCRWDLTANARVMTTGHATAIATIDMGDSIINDQATGSYMLQTQGPVTLDWNRCRVHTTRNGLVLDPNTTILGAPTTF